MVVWWVADDELALCGKRIKRFSSHSLFGPFRRFLFAAEWRDVAQKLYSGQSRLHQLSKMNESLAMLCLPLTFLPSLMQPCLVVFLVFAMLSNGIYIAIRTELTNIWFTLALAAPRPPA